MRSLSWRIHESRNWISLKLNDIDKAYVFIDLLIQYNEFRQNTWKIIIYELILNFIWYLSSESINLCSLISFKLFNKIQKLRKEACKFKISLLKFFQFHSNTVRIGLCPYSGNLSSGSRLGVTTAIRVRELVI